MNKDNKNMTGSKKAAMEFDTLMYWIIGVVIMLTLIAFYFKLGGQFTLIVEKLRNLFRFGA